MDGELIYSLPSLDDVWLSELEHGDRREWMHAPHHQHEDCQYITFCHTLIPLPSNSPDIAAVSNDDSSVDSSAHVEMSKS